MRALRLLVGLVAAVTTAATAAASANETVLGVYIFHRHGDRTAKALPPVHLTALGADEVHGSAAFYRSRYVAVGAPRAIRGLQADVPVASQLSVTSPVDNVLRDSALAFTQGLYPPIGRASSVLRNGTAVEAPLGGYQYVAIYDANDAASSADAEGNEWLQGSSGCPLGEVSSQDYLLSDAYSRTYSGSLAFYQSLMPIFNSTFTSQEATFKNAYTLFDYINVATIHNATIPADYLLTNATLLRLFDLASIQQWNLAFNRSSPVRAISGTVLAGQVVQALGAVIAGDTSAIPLSVQFGSYGTFMSFFGMANLTDLSPDFEGLVNYASSMVFELVVTNSSAAAAASGPPYAPEDLSVRYYFANGTAAHNTPSILPLFGQSRTTLPWTQFKSSMDSFAVQNTSDWCRVCGSTTGQCAADVASSPSNSSSSSCDHNSGHAVSRPVAGVIGAFVTLAVIMIAEAAVMGLGGLRLVRKSSLAAAGHGAASSQVVSSGAKAQ